MTNRPDLAWLDQLHDDFVEAFRSGDTEALGRFYSDEAVMLPPSRTLITGREGAVAFWKGVKRIQDLVFEPTSVKPMGDGKVVRDAGNLLVTARRGEEGATFNTAAKYVALWVQSDGGWKLDSIMWNSAEAPRPRRGAGGRGAGRRGGGGGGAGAGGGARKAGRGAGGAGGAPGQRGGLGRGARRPDMDRD